MRRSLLVLLLTLFAVAGCNRKAPEISADYPVTKLSERVYVIHGPNENPNKKNQGFFNNPGFVLTKKGVVVIDPGSSVQSGEMVLKKIAAVTQQPVIAVFNTHIHGDHWLGNDAIKAAYPDVVIYGHTNMIPKASQEGESWIKQLNDMTDGAVRGTKVVAPNLATDHGDVISQGGIHFRVYHLGVAHTDGDIMVEVVEDKVLFLGDIVFHQRAGNMNDGNFKGNISSIEAALKSGAKVFVPGHGPSGGREVPEAYRNFQKTLTASVRKYLDQGLSDFEMKDKVLVELAPYRKWLGFDDVIGKFISLAYLEAEADMF